MVCRPLFTYRRKMRTRSTRPWTMAIELWTRRKAAVGRGAGKGNPLCEMTPRECVTRQQTTGSASPGIKPKAASNWGRTGRMDQDPVRKPASDMTSTARRAVEGCLPLVYWRRCPWRDRSSETKIIMTDECLVSLVADVLLAGGGKCESACSRCIVLGCRSSRSESVRRLNASQSRD